MSVGWLSGVRASQPAAREGGISVGESSGSWLASSGGAAAGGDHGL